MGMLPFPSSHAVSQCILGPQGGKQAFLSTVKYINIHIFNVLL